MNMKEMNDALARQAIPDWEQRWKAQYAKDQRRGRRKAASVFGIKESSLDEMGIGLGVPGTPFSMGLKRNTDRLEGMHRWVPTDTLERAYAGTDEGVDPEELAAQEGRRGMVSDPLIGAGLAAALSHYGIPGLGALGKGRSAGLGALGGLLYNRFSADDRRKDMREAIKGVGTNRTPSSCLGAKHELDRLPGAWRQGCQGSLWSKTSGWRHLVYPRQEQLAAKVARE
jgi:hypothetical protein